MPSSSPHEVRSNLTTTTTTQQKTVRTSANINNNYYLQQKTYNGRPGSGLSLSVLGRCMFFFLLILLPENHI